MQKTAVLPVIIAGALALLIAAVGGSITVLDTWYAALQQPDWAPPNYLFPVIWTAIFAMIAVSGAYAWINARARRDVEVAMGLFALNGFLNLAWSFIFFRLQRPDWALIELLAFWLSILALILFCRRFSKVSAWLLLPYLAWVSTAGLLNYQVVQLNGPFGG
jgi:translocator protein